MERCLKYRLRPIKYDTKNEPFKTVNQEYINLPRSRLKYRLKNMVFFLNNHWDDIHPHFGIILCILSENQHRFFNNDRIHAFLELTVEVHGLSKCPFHGICHEFESPL